MFVDKVNLNKNTGNSRQVLNSPVVNSNSPTAVQTSLYNTKGMNVYFGHLAKGADIIENECIDILRAARNGRCRRFAENDIEDVIRILKPVKNPEDKPKIIREVMTIYGGYMEITPEGKMFKSLIDLISGRPENERFAILQFAENELQTAVKPMEAFFKLPSSTKDKLTKLLVQIDDVNDRRLFKSNEAHELVVNSLYETFRVPLYAHDDLDNINKIFSAALSDLYDSGNINKIFGGIVIKSNLKVSRGILKKSGLELLKADRGFYEKDNVYQNESAKSKVLSVVDNITEYFKQNI